MSPEIDSRALSARHGIRCMCAHAILPNILLMGIPAARGVLLFHLQRMDLIQVVTAAKGSVCWPQRFLCQYGCRVAAQTGRNECSCSAQKCSSTATLSFASSRVTVVSSNRLLARGHILFIQILLSTLVTGTRHPLHNFKVHLAVLLSSCLEPICVVYRNVCHASCRPE